MRSSRATRLLALLAATVLLALLPGCTSTLGTGTGLQRDVDSLRVAVDRLRQEQAETRARLDDRAPSAPDSGAGDGVERLQDRVEALEAQMRALTRALEGNDEMMNSLGYDMERLRRRQEDLARDISELAPAEVQDGAAGSDPATATGPATAPRDVGPPVVSAPPEPRVPPGEDPAGMFQKAYADYTRGDYELAALGFDSVLETRPDGALADDALYYLGEIAAAENRTEDALRWFSRVADEHPDDDKAPAAVLKKGLLLIDSNRIGEGVIQLDHLTRTWPESDEARLARNKLRALGVGP